MHEENGWGIEFSKLIDIKFYYENQSEWEFNLGIMVEKIIKEFGKEYKYNFETDNIEISFTPTEIKNIKELFDEETLELMDHFSNLIGSTSYNRYAELERKELERKQARHMDKCHDMLIRRLLKEGITNPEKYIK